MMVNGKENISIKTNRLRIDVIVFSVMLTICIRPLLYYSSAFPQQALHIIMVGILRGLQIIFYLLCGWNIINRQSFHTQGIILLVTALVIGITYIIYPINRPALLEVAPYMFAQCFFFGLGLHCKDLNTSKKMMKIFALISLAFAIYVVLIQNTIDISTQYFLVSSGLFWILLYFISEKKNIINMMLMALTFVLMFVFGRRAHLLYFALVILTMCLKKWLKEKATKKAVITLLFILGLIFMAVFYEQIKSMLFIMLMKLNVSSHTITMLLNGKLSNLNGRDAAYELAIRLMNEKPITGHGIGSTMVYNRQYLRWEKAESYIAWNTHNSILEFGTEFGYIGMTLFVIAHAKIYIEILKMNFTDSEQILMNILLGSGFFAILIGGGYLNNPSYALFLGFYFSMRSKYRTYKFQEKLR